MIDKIKLWHYNKRISKLKERLLCTRVLTSLNDAQLDDNVGSSYNPEYSKNKIRIRIYELKIKILKQ